MEVHKQRLFIERQKVSAWRVILGLTSAMLLVVLIYFLVNSAGLNRKPVAAAAEREILAVDSSKGGISSLKDAPLLASLSQPPDVRMGRDHPAAAPPAELVTASLSDYRAEDAPDKRAEADRSKTPIQLSVDSDVPQDHYVRSVVSAFLADADLPSAIKALYLARSRKNAFAAEDLLLSDLIEFSAGRVAPQSSVLNQKYVSYPRKRAERLGGARTIDQLAFELRQRLSTVGRPAGYLPANILGIGAEFDHVLLVDGSASRLFVISLANGHPVVTADFYICFGIEGLKKRREGDMRSPVGIYRILKTLSGPSLPQIYGPFAWELDFPNANDRRSGRSGSLIWIHGAPPGTSGRVPLATEGCFALSNEDLELLQNLIRPERTLVVALEKTDWVSEKAWVERHDEVLAHGVYSYADGKGIALDRLADWSRNQPLTLVAFPGGGATIYENPAQLVSTAMAEPVRPPVPVAERQDADTRLRVVSGGATLRLLPSRQVVANVAGGEILRVLSRQGSWIEVEYRGARGWVFSSLVTASAELAN